ncbi:MAG: hypothetical protein WEG36_12555 [Gemmatimonadota bacterium]
MALRRLRNFLTLWGGLVFFLPPSASAQAADEGALFLLIPFGAQGVGLARAMTPLTTSEGAFWNPAGLARLDRSSILVYQGEHVSGTATGVSALLAWDRGGTLGLSYALLDSGTQDLTDETGAVLGSITIRQHQAILSTAARFGSWIAGGVNFKFVQFRQGCRGQCPDGGVRATTYAADIGVQLQPFGSHPLELGVLVAHLGPRLKSEGPIQSEPLPSRLRFGAAYSLLRDVGEEELRVRLILEVEDRVRELGDPSVLLGSEISLGTGDRVTVRGGYIFGNRTQIDGAAVGLGLRYERFELGIARSLARGGPSLDQEPVHLTLGLGL